MISSSIPFLLREHSKLPVLLKINAKAYYNYSSYWIISMLHICWSFPLIQVVIFLILGVTNDLLQIFGPCFLFFSYFSAVSVWTVSYSFLWEVSAGPPMACGWGGSAAFLCSVDTFMVEVGSALHGQVAFESCKISSLRNEVMVWPHCHLDGRWLMLCWVVVEPHFPAVPCESLSHLPPFFSNGCQVELGAQLPTGPH